jgi:hypothetical protein
MESKGPIESAEVPDEIDIPHGMDIPAFANIVYVRKPGEMVYIDFAHGDPGVEYPPGRGTFVARVVMHPALAGDLAAKLSERLASREDG